MSTIFPSTLPANDFVTDFARSEPMLGLRIVSDDEGFLALEPHWDALLDRCAVRTPFMSWDWASLWLRHHRDQCRLCIGVLEDPRTKLPRAIAPMVIGRPASGPRKWLRHLTFIGCIGSDAAQGMDFLVPRGEEQSLAPSLARMFARNVLRWDVIDLPTMHEESPNLPWVKAALSHYASPGERFAAQNSYVMSLPDSWDEQLMRWKSKERVAFRSKWRKIMDQHQGRALRGGFDLPVSQAFDALWRLHSLRFDNSTSRFTNAASRALHTELVNRWVPTGRAILPLIEADGRIIAVRYGLVSGGKLWSFQTGYDPDYAQLSAGKLALGWAVQCAIEQGLHELDHLPGEARYKTEWSTHTRRVVHLEAFNPLSLTAHAFHGVRSLKRLIQRVSPASGTTTDTPHESE